MFKAKEVNPRLWSDIKVLFDNNIYSVVCGRYNGDLAIGERWNGSNSGDNGFPCQGAYPLWHVVPEFLWGSVLLGVLSQLSSERYVGYEEHEKNTRLAIADLMKPK